jgi:cell volume regulation protein A
VLAQFVREAGFGTVAGLIGGRIVVIALNRLALPQGLHAPFVTTAALVIFGVAQIAHASGFLAVYLAGIMIGNRPTRAHNSVVAFLDAATWLAQIVMFVLLGLLVGPRRLLSSAGPGLAVALTLMLVARPLPMLVGLSKAYLYFDVAFVVVMVSLLVQGWTLTAAARRLHVSRPSSDRAPRRIELDLPGQLEQELVGYSVRRNSLFLRRGLVPSWSKPTLVIRDEAILSPQEAEPVVAGDYIYLLAPPEKAEALDRFFVDMPPVAAPDPHLLGDFTVSGDVTLDDLASIYGVRVAPDQARLSLADYFDVHLDHAPHVNDTLPLDEIVLVARSISGHRVNLVGLRLPEEEEQVQPPSFKTRTRHALARAWSAIVNA